MTDFTGRTALVTGATSGIGHATADLLAARGAHVIVSGRSETRGEAVVAAIRSKGGAADFIAADLSHLASTRDLAARAVDLTGSVDILVNNAGVFPFASTADTSDEMFDLVYSTNVRAPFVLVSSLVPAMVERGHGSVITVSTITSLKGLPGATAYNSSKAALNQLTRIWTAEYAGTGVRFNTIGPGITETEGVQAALGPDERSALIAITPLGRIGLPTEVAEVIAFVASDAASYVHGAFLPVDGGSSAT